MNSLLMKLFSILTGWLMLAVTLAHGAPRLEVDHERSWADQRIAFKLTGVAPGQRVTLELNAKDIQGISWSSSSEYIADPNGEVNPSTNAPVSGDYDLTDGMGLFWSMKPQRGDVATAFFFPSLPGYDCTLTAKISPDLTLSRTIHRDFYDLAATSARDIRDSGVIGTFYAPRNAGAGKLHPAVIYIGGIEGGVSHYIPATLTRYGVASLSLGYLNNSLSAIEGLPDRLVEIPVETLGHAVDWLSHQPGIDPALISLVAFSRGTELAQLAAIAYPQAFHKVVLYSPSSAVWSGVPVGWPFDLSRAAWTWNGIELPYARPLFLAPDFITGAPFSYFPGFSRTLNALPKGDPSFLNDGAIEAPMLLFSGGDDQVWPASQMADQIMERRGQSGRIGSTRHLQFPDAGHYFGLPFLPYEFKAMSFIALGEHAGANAQGSEAAWVELLRFLQP